MRARLIPLLLMLAFVLLATSLLTPAAAQPVSQSIRLPNQEYTESREDIKVKVLGGYVRINRAWVAGRWYAGNTPSTPRNPRDCNALRSMTKTA